MLVYPRITAPFRRDEDNKLILYDYKDPLVEYLANARWVGLESVVGYPIRIYYNQYKFRIAGRTDHTPVSTQACSFVQNLLSPHFKLTIGTIFSKAPVILFLKICDLLPNPSLYSFTPTALLYDVYDFRLNRWLERAELEELGEALGLALQPIRIKGPIIDLVNFIREPHPTMVGDFVRNQATYQRVGLYHPIYPLQELIARPAQDIYNANRERVAFKLKPSDFYED